jgi:hypothetical protein
VAKGGGRQYRILPGLRRWAWALSARQLRTASSPQRVASKVKAQVSRPDVLAALRVIGTTSVTAGTATAVANSLVIRLGILGVLELGGGSAR